MILNYTLSDKVRIGDYTLEYSNFSIFIKKNNSLIKVIEKGKDFNNVSYNKFVEQFKTLYKHKK